MLSKEVCKKCWFDSGDMKEKDVASVFIKNFNDVWDSGLIECHAGTWDGSCAEKFKNDEVPKCCVRKFEQCVFCSTDANRKKP